MLTVVEVVFFVVLFAGERLSNFFGLVFCSFGLTSTGMGVGRGEGVLFGTTLLLTLDVGRLLMRKATDVAAKAMARISKTLLRAFMRRVKVLLLRLTTR